MGSRTYLGRVERIDRTDPRGPVAHLRPLAQSAPDLLSWQRELGRSEVSHEFPNRGLVTWFDPPLDLPPHSVWVFSVEKQWSFNVDNPHHDAFRLDELTIPIEILDMRTLGEDGARRRLTTEGVELNFIPAERVVLWLEKRLAVGPVHLERRAQGSRYWGLSPDQCDQPLPCSEPLQDEALTPITTSKRRFLPPGMKLGPRLGQIDWASDEVILKRALLWLRKNDPAFTKTLGLVGRSIEHASEQVGDVDFAAGDEALYAYRVKRAREVITQLTARHERLDGLLTEILQLPNVAAGIEAARVEAERQVVEKVTSSMQEVSEQVEDKRGQVEEAAAELQRLQSKIAEQRSALEARIDHFDAVMQERLAQIVESPEHALAEVAIVRAALELDGGRLQQPRDQYVEQPTPETIVGQIFSNQTPSDYLDDVMALRRSLSTALKVQGLSGSLGRMLHSALLAGAVPLLTGTSGLDALDTYGRVVAGERVLWIPVAPSMLEPKDLLGRFEPDLGRFVPSSSGLLDLLLYAKKTDDLYLVVLDGVDRAPVDHYLGPLLTCYADAHTGRSRRGLPLVHPAVLPSGDPYRGATQLHWPTNVLLAGTLSDSPTRLPLPRSLWTVSTLLPQSTLVPGGNERLRVTERDTDAANMSPATVSASVWGSWRTSLESPLPTEVDDFIANLADRGFVLSRDVRRLAIRLYEAAQTWTNRPKNQSQSPPDAGALELMVIECLIPLAISSGQIAVLQEVLRAEDALSEQVEEALNEAISALAWPPELVIGKRS